MPSSQELQEFLKSQIDELKPHYERLVAPLEKLRDDKLTARQFHKAFRKVVNTFDDAGPEMAVMEDFTIPSHNGAIPVRLYVPHGASDVAGPTTLFFHGGGFVSGSIESHEGIARRLAGGSNIRLLSVEYRLAPEHPYPSAPDDCEAVLNWLFEGHGVEKNLSPSRIALSLIHI